MASGQCTRGKDCFDIIEVDKDFTIIPFFSSSGSNYVIKVTRGRWTCNCPAFKWHYNRTGCKHIDFVKEQQAQ